MAAVTFFFINNFFTCCEMIEMMAVRNILQKKTQAAFLHQVPAAKFKRTQVEGPFSLAGELAKDRPAAQRGYKVKIKGRKTLKSYHPGV